MTSLHPRTQLQTCKICFIGGGNMGVAMIAGLLHKKNGVASPDPQNISVSEPWEVNRRKLEESDALSGIRVETSNVEAARGADVLLLAVKPQVAEGVCRELAASWSRDQKGGRGDGVKLPLIVSIAGGITMDTLIRWFTIGDGELRVPRIVRVMPNTPALVGEGASASFAGPGISKDDEELVTELLQSFSKVTTWVKKEELMDVVTGISGAFNCWLIDWRFSQFKLSLLLFDFLLLTQLYRIRTSIFLPARRAYGLSCDVSWTITGTGSTTCSANLSRCWTHARPITRLSCATPPKRHESQRNH
jgi:pyrroline-5-carboxylate reductase